MVYALRVYRVTEPARKAYKYYSTAEKLIDAIHKEQAPMSFTSAEPTRFPDRVFLVYLNALLYSYLYQHELKRRKLTGPEFVKGMDSCVLPMIPYLCERANAMSSYSSVSDSYSNILRITVDGYIKFHAPRFDHLLQSHMDPNSPNLLFHAYVVNYGEWIAGNVNFVNTCADRLNLETTEVLAAINTIYRLVSHPNFKKLEVSMVRELSAQAYFTNYLLSAMVIQSQRLYATGLSSVNDTRGSTRLYTLPFGGFAPTTYAMARRNPETPPSLTVLQKTATAFTNQDRVLLTERLLFLQDLAALGIVNKEAVDERLAAIAPKTDNK